MPTSTMTENRYAVCIGINEYQPSAGLSSLRYAEGDAQAMDSLLGQLGFAAENRRLLVGKVATLDAVNDALSTMILDKPGKNDLVVFYFAGHSLPLVINEREVAEGAEPRSEVFLTTYDFDREKIKQSPSFRKQHALGMERLRTVFFEGEGSRKRLFVFDSCYSGDFYGPRYRDEADPVQGYIKHMLESSSTGRVALSSCLPIQKAVEDPALGHGRFTYYLLEALSGQAVEALGRDGCLTVNSLFDFVAKHLPPEQRPVLSGVQQDTFELVCYEDKTVQLQSPFSQSEQTKQAGKEERLRAMLADNSSFMKDRLSSFVGREKEFAEICQRIAEKQQTGGYVTITGQAGQGKSSIIAKLVQEYGTENVAFHFIPFNPGPDHQVGLLRNIMARLILRYDLSDLYVVSESRPALRDYFPKVLAEVVAKGGQEVIFVDGLDQLEEDATGVRDLSFLPNNPPPGVVFVLGTRPNDTLRPLELLKPRYEYRLPNLSRQDFDRILQHRYVKLNKDIVDQFYHAMQGNALFLDYLAKEIAQSGAISPEDLIKQLAANPEHLFSLTITRLKRQPLEWREVIKPVLGVLLVAREPLGVRHIRQILGAEDDRLREGFERLGGLIVRDWQQRYSLFHLKFYEYLRQDEQRSTKEYIFATDEEEAWHKRLAVWCERGYLATIWQDAKHDPTEQQRREYARQHYLTHLYHAHEWHRLFEVLDTVQYGQAKMHDDPSTRSYTQDLNLGRQAAAYDGWTFVEGVSLLPRLWQYTLLCCSLTSRADQYPTEAFRLLILLQRKREALGLADLLTRPAYKARVLLQIAEQLSDLSAQEPEWQEVLIRAYDVAQTIEDGKERAIALRELGAALTRAQQWERAEAVWTESEALIRSIEDSKERAVALRELQTALTHAQQWERAEALIRFLGNSYERAVALRELGTALVHTQQWERAEVLIRSIEDDKERAVALSAVGTALAQAQQWERADAVWYEAEAVIHSIGNSYWRARALRELGAALAQAQQWERAELLIRSIEDSEERAVALRELGAALAHTQQWERADAVWYEAETVIHSIGNSYWRARALRELGRALAHAQQWKSAELLIRYIQDDKERAVALSAVGTALAQAQQWERADAVWSEIGTVIRSLEDNNTRAVALQELRTALVHAQQWERAEALIRSIKDSHEQEVALQELRTALVHAQQWERAEALIRSIKDSNARAVALRELRTALVHTQQWERAEALILSIRSIYEQGEALWELGTALAQAQQWERAGALILSIEDSYWRARAFQEVGTALAQAQQWERADAVWAEIEAIIRSIGNSYWRARAFQEVGAALVHAQQWERAKALIRSIKDSHEQVAALCELGAALAQAQQWERAEAVWAEIEAVIRSLEDSNARVVVLQELGAALAQAQQWERAETVIRSIGNSYWRAKALQELGAALAQAQQWERAEAVIRSLEDSNARVVVLQELGTALAQAQQWERAEALIRSIKDRKEQGVALRGLAAKLAKANEYEQLLNVIQHSWWLTETREDAFQLFPISTWFISREPQLGNAFYEAFTWVDTFFKG